MQVLKRLCFLIFSAVLVFNESVFADTATIYFIDVNQADSTLIVSPAGNTLLVDSGENNMGDRIRSVMAVANVTRIDHYVTTHYHKDHYGSIDELVESGVAIGTAYDRGDKAFLPASKTSQATYIRYQNAVGSNATHLMRGETIPLDPTMVITVVSSGGVVLGEEQPTQHGGDENDMSVTLLIQLGNFRMFVGGDIHEHTEQKIADLDRALDVDIYQANHHGSHTSSSQDFMNDLNPTLIVISNGNHGGHKHPRQTTLTRYAGLSSTPTVLQTNKYTKGGTGGSVEDEFIGDLDTTGDDGTIRVDVDTQTNQFTASYRTFSRPFTIKARSDPSGVRIASLMPNPVGQDFMLETVTLQNSATQSVQISEMVLRDASGRLWVLQGSIAAGANRTIVRNGMPMSLNNGGDTIQLLDGTGSVIDEISYGSAQEGIEIVH